MRWTRTHGPIKHISYTVCFLRGPHYTQAFSAAKSDVTALASSRVKLRERAEVRPSRRPRREKQGGRSKWLPASPPSDRAIFFFPQSRRFRARRRTLTIARFVGYPHESDKTAKYVANKTAVKIPIAAVFYFRAAYESRISCHVREQASMTVVGSSKYTQT